MIGREGGNELWEKGWWERERRKRVAIPGDLQ